MAAAGLFMGHLSNYVLFTKTLTAQQFTALTVIMVIARIFDAFNDPVMGNILDVTRTRWGKFKPWIFSGCISTVAVVVVSFTNTLQGWSYVILFGVMYLAFSVTYTMNDISYWGMLPSLTSNADDRNKLMCLTNIMCGVAAFLCGLIVPTFTAGKRVIGGSAVTAYAALAMLFCSLMLVTQSLTLIGVKERPLPAKSAAAGNVSINAIIGVIKGNDQVMWNGILLFLHFIVYMLVATMAPIYLYLSFGYNGALTSIFTTAGMLAASFVIFLFTPISRRFSRKSLVRTGLSISVTGYFLLLLFGSFWPGNLSEYKFYALTGANMLVGLENVFYLILLVNIANCVEYNEYITGNRNEGIIFSVRAFVSKLGMAVGLLLSMLIYLAVGVLGFTNRISEIENAVVRGEILPDAKSELIDAVIREVSAGSANALLCFLSLIPLICLIVAYVIYSKKIILSEEKYDEIVRELTARISPETVETVNA